MLKAGITGGIGSGKSVVCQVFQTLGIPVFNADDAARHLMEHDAQLIAGITDLLGPETYANGHLQRAWISAQVYGQHDKLARLNALVHPAVITYAQQWFSEQNAPYVIKEAAIFFESGSNRDMDIMIGVYAPEEVRTRRAMARSNMTREQVKAIIARQMNEEEKMALCDYVITNDDTTALLPQVLRLHELLSQKAGL